MKPLGAAVAAALLLGWTAAGWAGEPIPAPYDFATGGTPVVAPHDFAAATPYAGIAPQSAYPAGPGCTSCGASCGHGGGCWEWLTYRPLHHTRCGECCGCCGRWTPLYLYFLDHCQEHPCTACGCTGGCCGWAGHLSGTLTGAGFVSH